MKKAGPLSETVVRVKDLTFTVKLSLLLTWFRIYRPACRPKVIRGEYCSCQGAHVHGKVIHCWPRAVDLVPHTFRIHRPGLYIGSELDQ
jgi:hypothetical protein